MTYVLLNGLVLAAVGLSVAANWCRPVPRKRLLLLVSGLLLLTAIGDSLIITSGIVAYHATSLLGIYVGPAPIEDFAYSLVASLLIPYIWEHTRHVTHR